MINLKLLSLGLLVIQNSALTLVTRYSRGVLKETYLVSTTIFLSEFFKFVFSASMIYFQLRKKGRRKYVTYYQELIISSLKTSIPAIIYFFQNFLTFIALQNLSAGVYAVCSQLKIVTAVIFSIILLRKTVSWSKWRALFILVLASILVQYTPPIVINDSISQPIRNPLIGGIAVLSVVTLSGIAGTYVEMILRNTKLSIWDRNLQLSLYSMCFALLQTIMYDRETIVESGFFGGYSLVTFFLIFINAVGGILVAMVMKYADNVIKGFATSVAIVITSLVSVFLFENQVDLIFWIGVALVIISIFNYNEASAAETITKKEPLLPLHSSANSEIFMSETSSSRVSYV